MPEEVKSSLLPHHDAVVVGNDSSSSSSDPHPRYLHERESSSRSESSSSSDEPTVCYKQLNGSHDTSVEMIPTRTLKTSVPKPAANPLQFVKIGPCDLYRSAQQQLKKEKPTKEIKEEDAEDWQSNLDSWKCNRRKQQEHIIERVVEVKKLELEEHDRNRKRTKTFSEMMEERTSKGARKPSLALYPDEDNEDLSDLGLSSNKLKSPTIPEKNENGKFSARNGDNDCNGFENDNGTVSDGDIVDTAVTYQSAIQNYETRMQALTNGSSVLATKKPPPAKMISSPSSTPNDFGAATTRTSSSSSPIVRKFGGRSGSAAKIEEKLCELERTKNHSVSSTDLIEANKARVQIPKINIFQRKEIFEKGKDCDGSSGSGSGGVDNTKTRRSSDELQPPQHVRTIKERLSSLEKQAQAEEQFLLLPSVSRIKAADVSMKDRLSSINEKIKDDTVRPPPPPPPPPPSLPEKATCDEETIGKEFSSGRSSSSSEEFEHSGHIHHYHQHHRSLDSLQGHDSPNGFCFERVQSLESIDCCGNYPASVLSGDTDREDSGIHTADVSSSVSQADDFDLHADSSSMETAVVETKTPITEVESSHDELAKRVDDVVRNESSELVVEPEEELVQENAQISTNDTLTPKEQEKEEEGVQIQEDIAIENALVQPSSLHGLSGDHCHQLAGMVAFEHNVLDGLSPTESVFAFEPSSTAVEPPKEKPPPPPPPEQSDDELDTAATIMMASEVQQSMNLRRMDSTKRIKKELRQKRSFFLGIEGGFDDDSYLEPQLESVKRPPDMTSFLQEERRFEKLLYRQSICSESDSTLGESRDSGVELDGGSRHTDENHWTEGGDDDGGTGGHSRQASGETFANMSTTTSEEDEIMRKEREILEILELEERQRSYEMEPPPSSGVTRGGDLGTRLVLKLKELERQKNICWNTDDEEDDDEIGERKREEQRQRVAELQYDQLPERKQPEWALLQQQWAGRSLQDVNRDCSTKTVLHLTEHHHHCQQMPKMINDYRNSMPNIQQESMTTTTTATTTTQTVPSQYRVPPPIPPNKPAHLRESALATEVSTPQQMSKQTLHALSAVPRSKIMATDSWVLSKKKPRQETYNYQHWLIQEAEHRRITEYQQRCSGNNDTQHISSNYVNVNVVSQHGGDYPESTPTRLNEVSMKSGDGCRLSAVVTAQQHMNRSSSSHSHTSQMLPHRNRNQGFVQEKNNNSKSSLLPQPEQQQYSKPLPDSVIQTLTQRVQNRLGSVHDANKSSRRRENYSNGSNQREKMLSVSGKKKCSHCGEELGRGAAMIIESLRLFYHIDCFKCCVCCVQLGDGLIGTDVRVRNSKLHCHSCYSNDEGVKFSCV